MSKCIHALTHRFSEIEGLQNAHTLVYSLEVDEAGRHHMVLTRSGSAPCKEDTCVPIPPKTACLLLRFFYENAVQPEHWQDIVADYCTGFERCGL